jgi:tetratricopeptide (TPR) repeat protein
LAIDPDYAPAHSSLGWIAMRYESDLAQAARHYERAMRLAPANVGIINSANVLLISLGRVDESIKLQEYATARDPVSPIGHANLGVSYYCAGRPAAAIASLDTALRLSPDFIGAHYFIGTVRLLQGEAAAALPEMQQEPLEAFRWLGLVMAYQALGDSETSDRVLTELIEKYGQEWAYNIAAVFAYRNEADRAFGWLDKAVEYSDSGLSDTAVDPLFRNIHSDPRWMPFLERIGKSPAQLNAIDFEVTLLQ